jgi:hypothetical protein
MTWISVKDGFPPFGEVVEVHVKERFNGVLLDHAAYMKADKYIDKNYWTFHGMNEFAWSDKGFEIKYWRYLNPLPNGKKPYFKCGKWGMIKVIFKKTDSDSVD